MPFSSIQPIDRALSGATIPGQSGPGSNDNEGVLCIPQSSCKTGHNQHIHWGRGLTPLQRCSRCILQPQPTGQYTELMSK